MYQLTSHNQTLLIDRPLVMGIVNCTPDSFYTGSRTKDLIHAYSMIDQMVSDGADIVDIGGRSTRPGSVEISAEEELERVMEVIRYIAKKYPNQWMSIDTTKAMVAHVAIQEGCRIINDISSGDMDNEMIETVSRLKVPYISMHMQGRPDTMQSNPTYDQITKDVFSYFNSKITQFQQHGIEQIIIDPGFGFGKTIEHNYTLLRELDSFKSLQKPLLVGLSRKSMMYKLLNTTPEESLNATSALHMVALLKGAHILRVHDVKPAKEIIQLYQQVNP